MRPGGSREPSPELKDQLRGLEQMPDDAIDTGEIPVVEDWSGARRGALYRPRKTQISIRIDADVLQWFKDAAGEDEAYQTLMNRALRAHVLRAARKADAPS
jgi:uncharacterized protein (DUF4415 family)